MNAPTVILHDQFRFTFNSLEDTLSFIRPSAPYDTDKYYKATLKFGSNSQKVYSENVYQDDKSLYSVINTLQTQVDKLKTQLSNLDTNQIKHYIKKKCRQRSTL
jgi:hypothetical protein